MLSSSRGTWTTRILVILAVVVAYYAGSLRPAVRYHTAVPYSAPGAVSFQADGSTFGLSAPDGVPWMDATGLHLGSRPECLPPDGTTAPVRFATVDVTIEGATWSPIVWVDCR